MFFPLSSVLVYPNSWWATLLVICINRQAASNQGLLHCDHSRGCR
jgi:hypothetical protein